MQRGKLAAAARIASRVISGCPEAPASPLHSGVAVGGTAPVVGFGANSERMSGSWAAAGVSRPTSSAPAQASRSGRELIGIAIRLLTLGHGTCHPAFIGTGLW